MEVRVWSDGGMELLRFSFGEKNLNVINHQVRSYQWYSCGRTKWRSCALLMPPENTWREDVEAYKVLREFPKVMIDGEHVGWVIDLWIICLYSLMTSVHISKPLQWYNRTTLNVFFLLIPLLFYICLLPQQTWRLCFLQKIIFVFFAYTQSSKVCIWIKLSVQGRIEWLWLWIWPSLCGLFRAIKLKMLHTDLDAT